MTDYEEGVISLSRQMTKKFPDLNWHLKAFKLLNLSQKVKCSFDLFLLTCSGFNWYVDLWNSLTERW